MSENVKLMLPWEYDSTRKHYNRNVIRHNGVIVAEVHSSITDTPEEQDARARFAVRAANNHAALVEALETIAQELDRAANGAFRCPGRNEWIGEHKGLEREMRDVARAALAKAQE